MYPYERGHCIIFGSYRYIIKEIENEKAFIVHISDPSGRKGRWIPMTHLPIPFGKVNIDAHS
ncbi:hypothetical protein bcgnr5378_06340 [Bacillus cereus]